MEALKSGKNILLFIDDKEGKYIKKFTSLIYSDKRVKECISNRYIPIVVKMSSHISYPIELYYTTIYPTLFIANAKDEIPVNFMQSKNFTTTDIYTFVCR